MGRLFHKVVATVVKERPPKERQVGNVLVRVGAVVWRVMRADVRMVIMFVRYVGAEPYMHLCVSAIILYLIRSVTGSQCSWYSAGVMCSYLDVCIRRRAAEFLSVKTSV